MYVELYFSVVQICNQTLHWTAVVIFVSENAWVAQDHYTIWPEGIIISIFDIKIETSGFWGLPN